MPLVPSDRLDATLAIVADNRKRRDLLDLNHELVQEIDPDTGAPAGLVETITLRWGPTP